MGFSIPVKIGAPVEKKKTHKSMHWLPSIVTEQVLVNKRFLENENAIEQALIKKSYALKSDVSLA